MKLRIWSTDQRQEKRRRKSGFPGVAWYRGPHHFRTKCSHFHVALRVLVCCIMDRHRQNIMNWKKC